MRKLEENNAAKKLNNPFAALKHKDFGIYWFGMCISTVGTWMQNIAQPWLAYQLTGSPLLLSVVSAMQFVPVLLFSLFAGVIIDKVPKKTLLLFTQAGSLIVTLILAILTYSGNIQYWHIVVVAAMLGVVNTLDMPVRHSFIIELVGKEDLMNAIALNSSVFNLARIIGPTLAALVMAQFGAAACFLVNSISFGAVIISLFFIKPHYVEKKQTKQTNVFESIRDGIKYMVSRKDILEIIILVAIVATLAMNFNILVPVLVKTVLGQEEAGYGMLMSFMGIGSFAGAIIIAAMSRNGPKRFFLWIVPYIISLTLILLGLSSNFFICGILLMIHGFFFIMFSTSCNTSLQLKANGEYRGRIISIYTLVFSGFTPFGNLIAGIVTDQFGVSAGFIVTGVLIAILMVPLAMIKSASEAS